MECATADTSVTVGVGSSDGSASGSVNGGGCRAFTRKLFIQLVHSMSVSTSIMGAQVRRVCLLREVDGKSVMGPQKRRWGFDGCLLQQIESLI